VLAKTQQWLLVADSKAIFGEWLTLAQRPNRILLLAMDNQMARKHLPKNREARRERYMAVPVVWLIVLNSQLRFEVDFANAE
jgi:hypothetical protein